jgi:hypothetical protein
MESIAVPFSPQMKNNFVIYVITLPVLGNCCKTPAQQRLLKKPKQIMSGLAL